MQSCSFRGISINAKSLGILKFYNTLYPVEHTKYFLRPSTLSYDNSNTKLLLDGLIVSRDFYGPHYWALYIYIYICIYI